MSTTLTVQNSINFVRPILKNQDLLVSNFEPAMTAANMVLGMLVGPPLKWPFNRNTFSQAVSAGAGTDYTLALPDFGFFEKAWLLDGNGKTHALEGNPNTGLAVETATARPKNIAVQNDDNAGNILFRLSSTSDQNYTLNGFYQKKQPLLTSPASVWAPIADNFAYIFDWGFLAVTSLLVNDSRFPIFEQYFLSRALGAQTGLTEQERNIFVGAWLAMTGTVSRSSLRDQLGTQALSK